MDSKNNKNNKNSKNNRNLRGVLVLLAWAVVLTIGFNYFAAYTGNTANKATSFEVDFSALADLVRAGKIRHNGLSEAAPATIRLRARAPRPGPGPRAGLVRRQEPA